MILRNIVIVALIPAVLALFAEHFVMRSETKSSCEVVKIAPFSVTTTYEGEIESRRVESVLSRFNGAATISEIVPDGSCVKQGDVLVRFGTSQIEQDLFKQEREFALAECDLENFEKAKLPIDLNDLENALLEARNKYMMEKRYLDETDNLLKDNLVSKEEVENQLLKVHKLEQGVKSAELKLQLTRQHTSPSALKRAKASMATAEQALNLARQQYSNCTVRAPIDGTVVYKPVNIGTEYRTVRVGDSVYENQPFMMIPDMSNLVAQCNVPETEFSKVQSGSAVVIVPVAYPDMKIKGAIETVTSMAQSIAWAPNWQKYFRAVVAVQGDDPRLRPGMSVHVHVLSYQNEQAILIPRTAVFWRADVAYCKVVALNGRIKTREIILGKSNATHCEVLEGLKPGEKVALE